MPKRYQRDLRSGRAGTYGFTTAPGQEIKPEQEKFTVELLPPEIAMLQFALRGLIEAAETMLPPERIKRDHGVATIDTEGLPEKLLSDLAILSVAGEVLAHLESISGMLDVVPVPGGMAVAKIERKKVPGN